MRRSGILVLICVLSIAVRASANDDPASGHSAPAVAPAHADPQGHATTQSVAPDEAIRRLADGNARFVAQTQKRPNQDAERRHETSANGQHPYAAVLCCADSRAPVELIFDAGIGDLFVARVAGNVADVDEIGTLEYGVDHLGITTILVMGHTKCGAVTAVVDHAHVTPNIEKLVDNIVPAADAARKTYPQLSGSQLVEKAIRMNVNQSIADLTARSDLLRERVKAGTLKIVGAVYDLNSGELDWLEPPAHAPSHAEPSGAHSLAPGPMMPHEHGATAHAHPAAPAPLDHASPSTQPAAASAKPRRENFIALGGLLAGASLASCGVFYFLRGLSSAH